MMRATVTLLKPVSGDGFIPITAPETFTGDDIGGIAAAVNYWLRIEVTPYWRPNTLHMEVEINAPSPFVIDALRHTIHGVAIAWRMAPSADPEDKP